MPVSKVRGIEREHRSDTDPIRYNPTSYSSIKDELWTSVERVETHSCQVFVRLEKMFTNNIVNKSCSGEDCCRFDSSSTPHPNDILEIAFFTFCILLMIKQSISPLSKQRGEDIALTTGITLTRRVPNATSLFSMNAVRHQKNRSHSSQEFQFFANR